MRQNKIIFGNSETPILEFENDDIVSISEEQQVALIGEELFIDQASFELRYESILPGLFKPSNYDRLITSDSKVFCHYSNYNIRKLPYGTPVFYSIGVGERIEFFSMHINRHLSTFDFGVGTPTGESLTFSIVPGGNEPKYACSYERRSEVEIHGAQPYEFVKNYAGILVAHFVIPYDRESSEDARTQVYGYLAENPIDITYPLKTPVENGHLEPYDEIGDNWVIVDGPKLKTKAYVKNVERLGKSMYRINCMSAIGLMNKQMHKGGIYQGETFGAVLSDVLGNDYTYSVDANVSTLQVYGWLKYATRRENLYQLIFAFGVTILRNSNGDMRFSFLPDDEPIPIPNSRVFSVGSVNYDEPASRIEVVEHGYYYNEDVESIVLFDNTSGDEVTNSLVTFRQPIYVDTITAKTGSNITVHSAGVNYMIVSGVGVITGRPYVHTTKVVQKDNVENVLEKVVRVENATLVTLTNSENVLERIAQFYFNATTIKEDIKLEDERCGKRYHVKNAFMEDEVGFLARISSRVSSFTRASCEFVSGFKPVGQGATYTHRDILTGSTNFFREWNIPASVFEKDVPVIRVVLIGKGGKGGDGEDGEMGYAAEETRGGKGGKGGKGGLAGLGGRVLSKTINCTGISSFSYRIRDDAVITIGDDVISSQNGVSSANGYYDQMSGVTYAKPGTPGLDGADGGNGGSRRAGGSAWYDTSGTNGGSVNSYLGGAFAQPDTFDGDQAGMSADYLFLLDGGGGGGGAAKGSAGGDAYSRYNHETDPIGTVAWRASDGGAGANGASGDAALQIYGAGGNGGHGGGGGGGAGTQQAYNYEYHATIWSGGGNPGSGGSGGTGSNGYNGCILVFY